MNFAGKKLDMRALTFLSSTILAGTANAAPEGQPCIPEPTDELVSYSDVRTCGISPIGDLDLYRFVGSEGEIVRIRASEGSGSFSSPDVCVSLRRPDGTTSVGVTCGEATTVVETTLDATGEHIIHVSEQGGDQTMTYTLVIERVWPTAPTNTTLESGISLAAEMISPIGDMDLYTFEGMAGDLVRIDASEGNGSFSSPDVCIDLRRPDGSRLGSVACNEISAAIEATLDQDGEYTVIMEELGGDQVMNFNLLYSCILGACLSAQRPVCDIELGQATYTAGEAVTATVFRLANPGPDPVGIEWKLWLEIPDSAPIGIVNLGADGRLVLPPGFDRDLGPLPLFTVTADFPAGNYELGCRFLNPVKGETIRLDRGLFEIVQQ